VTNFFESCHPWTAVLVKQSSTVAHEGSDPTGVVGQLVEQDRVVCTRQQTSSLVAVLEWVIRLVFQGFLSWFVVAWLESCRSNPCRNVGHMSRLAITSQGCCPTTLFFGIVALRMTKVKRYTLARFRIHRDPDLRLIFFFPTKLHRSSPWHRVNEPLRKKPDHHLSSIPTTRQTPKQDPLEESAFNECMWPVQNQRCLASKVNSRPHVLQ
jgi:hypothetical protein